MSIVFARLFALLSSLEREYGVGSLEKDERIIFDFVVTALAEGKEVTSADVVSANITSRASAYRHLSALKDAGLLSEISRDGRKIITVSAKFENFKESLEGLAEKIVRMR